MTEPTLDSGITTDIYPMPAFITIDTSNLERTVDFFVDGLGFVSLFTLPGPDGVPMLVHLRRWRYQDILVRRGATPDPGTGWTVSFAALAEELDGLAEQARRHPGATVDGPADTPWNTRDLAVTDPDGFRIVFTARRPEGEVNEAFDAEIRRLAAEQLPAGKPAPAESPGADRP